MIYAFQDRENLFLVMDLMKGGDLRYHIGRYRRFNEEITLGLDYLHTNKIIHRDIKPENLVLDRKDLGIAREFRQENAADTSGTPGYMAPEVLCRQNHSYEVDHFAVGVIAYEFMLGKRPYVGRNRKEIRETILAKQVQIKKSEIPAGWSIEAADFVNRSKEENFDFNQISIDERDTNEDLIQQNATLLRKNSIQLLFSGYSYEPPNVFNDSSCSGSLSLAKTANTVNTQSTNN